MVTSLDGSQSLGGSSGKLSSDLDFKLLHHLRAGADVVLVGSTTAVREKYTGIFVGQETVTRRVSNGKAPYPTLAVLSRNGVLPADSLFFEKTPLPTLVLVTAASDDELQQCKQRAESIGTRRCRVIDARGLNGGFGSAIELLHSMGAMHVLCEGGPTVINGLAVENLIDELCLTISPLFVGGENVRNPVIGADGFEATFASAVGGLAFTRWRRIAGTRDGPEQAEFRTFASISSSPDG